jgi:hypothetical protein
MPFSKQNAHINSPRLVGPATNYNLFLLKMALNIVNKTPTPIWEVCITTSDCTHQVYHNTSCLGSSVLNRKAIAFSTAILESPVPEKELKEPKYTLLAESDQFQCLQVVYCGDLDLNDIYALRYRATGQKISTATIVVLSGKKPLSDFEKDGEFQQAIECMH